MSREKKFRCIGRNCKLCCEDPLTPPQLTLGDVTRIVNFMEIDTYKFAEQYTEFTPVPIKMGTECINYEYYYSLILPCKLWDNGCIIYNSRPIMCSLFPYIQLKSKLKLRKLGKNIDDEQLRYIFYQDFPCMRNNPNLDKNQSIFYNIVKSIFIEEDKETNNIFKEYNLDISKSYESRFSLDERKFFENCQNTEMTLETRKSLDMKKMKIVRNNFIKDFGFESKIQLKKIFLENNLKNLFKSTSDRYLKLLSRYKGLI